MEERDHSTGGQFSGVGVYCFSSSVPGLSTLEYVWTKS